MSYKQYTTLNLNPTHFELFPNKKKISIIKNFKKKGEIWKNTYLKLSNLKNIKPI